MSTGLKILPLGAGSMGSRRPRDLTLMMACPQAPTRRCGTLAERSEAGYAAERGAFVAAIRGGRPREHGRADEATAQPKCWTTVQPDQEPPRELGPAGP